jgi:hypothetical protein
MAKVILGNHAAVFVPPQDRDKIRQFYRNVLGGKITSQEDQKDLFRIGDNFYLAFLYGDYADESKFLRSGRSIWLEIKSDNVEEMSRKMLESGLVEKLDIPDPTSTSKHQGDSACGSSESTRTSPNMRGSEKARTLKGQKKQSGDCDKK